MFSKCCYKIVYLVCNEGWNLLIYDKIDVATRAQNVFAYTLKVNDPFENATGIFMEN